MGTYCVSGLVHSVNTHGTNPSLCILHPFRGRCPQSKQESIKLKHDQKGHMRMIPLDHILGNGEESRVMGSRSVIARGRWWMKEVNAKGMRKALGVVAMFRTLIIDGDFTGVYISQNSYTLNACCLLCIHPILPGKILF